jgi:hypothetical protein
LGNEPIKVGPVLFRPTKDVKDKSLCRDDNYIRLAEILYAHGGGSCRLPEA